jgi:hypothetical protein
MSSEALSALSETARVSLIQGAERRLMDAGAHVVLRSVAELSNWMEQP